MVISVTRCYEIHMYILLQSMLLLNEPSNIEILANCCLRYDFTSQCCLICEGVKQEQYENVGFFWLSRRMCELHRVGQWSYLEVELRRLDFTLGLNLKHETLCFFLNCLIPTWYKYVFFSLQNGSKSTSQSHFQDCWIGLYECCRALYQPSNTTVPLTV